MSRVILITLLLSILASCRILCSTSACACEHVFIHGDHQTPVDQVPHQVNDDHCLCNGGLQVTGSAPIVASLNPCLAILPIDLPHGSTGFLPRPAESPSRGSAAAEDRAWLGDPSEACARLQLFRC